MTPLRPIDETILGVLAARRIGLSTALVAFHADAHPAAVSRAARRLLDLGYASRSEGRGCDLWRATDAGRRYLEARGKLLRGDLENAT